jgi:hypothetical protein
MGLPAASNESKFSNVVMFEQAKSLRNLKELSEKVDSTQKEVGDKENEKRVDALNENLKSLSAIIKKQTETAIKTAMKNGFGEDSAKAISNNNMSRQEKVAAGSMTRKFLLGNQSADDVKKGSWMNKIEQTTGLKVGKFSPSMAINGWLQKKEAAKAHEQEKGEFIKGALGNDKRAIALKNLKGEDYAKEDAGKRFEEMKAKEKEVAKHQAAMDESKAAGYSPKVKDTKARDKAAGELAMLDPRQKQFFAAEGKKADKGDTTFAAAEDKQESTAMEAANDAKMSGLQQAEVAADSAMGATLLQSLEVQKQMLQALQAGGGSGGSSGGSLVDSAVDVASNVAGKGKGLLGKAGGFLKAAGPGLLKGGVGALGGMALEAGGDALKENGYEKTGGAVSTLGTAASYAGTGAMIGSVIPGVGTAIGAGVGGAIGLGKGLYDNWGSMFGGKKKEEVTPTPQPTPDVSAAGPRSSGGDAPAAAASKNNEEVKAQGVGSNSSNTTVVNTSNNVSNSNTTQASRPGNRNQESSVSQYIGRRYG